MRGARALAGTALLSAGGLLLEISLTRVLSVLYAQSYVFLVLSVAVLGVGLGAALAALLPGLRRLGTLPLAAALAGFAAFGLVALLTLTMGAPRFLMLAAPLVPYLFVGFALAVLFGLHPEDSSRLYWADLSGAGLGVALAVPLLNAFGGLGASALAAGLLALAAFFFVAGAVLARGLAGLVLLAALGQVAFSPLGLEPRDLATPKPILEALKAGGEVVATRWDAFSRTDLVRTPDGATYLYMDGGAGSLVPEAASPARWTQDIGSFPFVADAPGSAFLIGPGGGLDVALARHFGTQDITAVEVNRSSVAFVRDLSDYAGEVYGEGVTVYADEGRSVLRRSGRTYDLIFLSQVVTGAAEARGYALAENTLYTLEAFGDYLEHLTPGGQLALKLYDELTLTRALLSAVRALADTGMSEAEAAGHVLALLDTRADPPVPLLLVKRTAPDRDEAVRLARAAEARGYALLFVPGLIAQPPLDALLTGTTSVEAIASGAAEVDLRPVTDTRPFFYSFERGLPGALRPLVAALGLAVLLAALLYALSWPRLEPGLRVAPPLFALLGAGFMLLEIALLQRTGLLLGHPTLTLSLVLGTLLLGGGVGSVLAGARGARRGVALAAGLAALLWGAWQLLWPALAESLLAQGVGVRSAVTALSLLPLALALGVPFPLLLRRVGASGARAVALGWAVNGVFSVVGSVAATAAALRYGFGVVGLAGVLVYAVVSVLAASLNRPGRRH